MILFEGVSEKQSLMWSRKISLMTVPKRNLHLRKQNYAQYFWVSLFVEIYVIFTVRPIIIVNCEHVALL